MNNADVFEVLEHFVAEHKLSRRKLAFLETVHAQNMECIGGYAFSPDVAGQWLASQLDRPNAIYTCQLVAELLDFLKPLPSGHRRLVEVTDALVESGHLEPEQAEELYAEL